MREKKATACDLKTQGGAKPLDFGPRPLRRNTGEAEDQGGRHRRPTVLGDRAAPADVTLVVIAINA
jgi:hypothetical protein